MKGLNAVVMAVTVAGCSSTKQPTLYTGLPEQLPVRAPSSMYAPYLTCLGELVQAGGSGPVDVLIGGLEDETISPRSVATGFLSFGGRAMARTSLARFAPVVSAITPSAFDPERDTLLVKGAFTEVDRVPMSRAWGLAFRIAGVELTLDGDNSFDVITLDMELALPDGRQLPGMAIALSVMVNSQTKDAYLLVENGDGNIAASAAGKIKSISRRHAAQRILIEAGLYWLFSQHFGIDGQACLDSPKNDMGATRQLEEDYREMSRTNRVVAIQRLLQQHGYDIGSATGHLDSATRQAISEYQIQHGEPPTGQASAYLYVKLASTKPTRTRIQERDKAARRLSKSSTLHLSLLPSKGSRAEFRAGDALTFSVQPSQDAHVFCFYKEASGAISRVFPNRFVPNSHVKSGKPQVVPDSRMGFDISLDVPGKKEEIMCIASTDERTQHVTSASSPDLAPLNTRSLMDVRTEFEAAANDGAIAVARMPVTINP